MCFIGKHLETSDCRINVYCVLKNDVFMMYIVNGIWLLLISIRSYTVTRNHNSLTLKTHNQ